MSKNRGGDKLGMRLRQISADLKLFIEKRMELLMLDAGEYFSGWMAASVQRSLGALIIFGGVGFLLFALAIYLGDLLNSDSLGYAIVSLPMLLIGVLFMYLKPRSVFVLLQKKFEREVMKAVNRNVDLKQDDIKPEQSVRSTLEKENEYYE